MLLVYSVTRSTLSLVGDASKCLMSILPRLKSIHEAVGKGVSWEEGEGVKSACQAANMSDYKLANRPLAVVDTKSRDQR